MILRPVEPVYMKDYGESPSQFKRSLIQTGQIFGVPGQSIPNGSEFKSPDQFRPNGSRPRKTLAACKGALGGSGPMGHFGLFRSHFEWKAISNGRLLRSHFENFEWKDENQAAEGFRRLTTRYPDVKAKCFDVKFRDCEHFDSRNTFKPHLAPEALDREPFKWTFSQVHSNRVDFKVSKTSWLPQKIYDSWGLSCTVRT